MGCGPLQVFFPLGAESALRCKDVHVHPKSHKDIHWHININPDRQRHKHVHKHSNSQTHSATLINADILSLSLSLSLSLTHTHTNTHTYKTLLSTRVNPCPGKTATSIFNSSLTGNKCLLAEHKYKIVTQKKKPDLCASFKNAFLVVRSYNYRPAFRLNETHNQDIREASQDYEICRPREDEKFHPARTS